MNLNDRANLQRLPKPFVVKSIQWDSMHLLEACSRTDIVLAQDVLEAKRGFFFHAAYTEYDAENLCRHIDTLDIRFTPEFKAFEKTWRRDELNHYIGFRYIYSLMFNQSVSEVAELIETRPFDFSQIQKFFKDEFVICLLIAYDEILTTRGYASEFGLYKSLGSSVFLDWFKRVTRDEAFHFHNIMQVIKARHSNRIDEIPFTLKTFIEKDLQRDDYRATFVLDHDLYNVEFLQKGAAVIERYF